MHLCASSKCVELFGLDEDECEDFCLVIEVFEDDENLF